MVKLLLTKHVSYVIMFNNHSLLKCSTDIKICLSDVMRTHTVIVYFDILHKLVHIFIFILIVVDMFLLVIYSYKWAILNWIIIWTNLLVFILRKWLLLLFYISLLKRWEQLFLSNKSLGKLLRRFFNWVFIHLAIQRLGFLIELRLAYSSLRYLIIISLFKQIKIRKKFLNTFV